MMWPAFFATSDPVTDDIFIGLSSPGFLSRVLARLIVAFILGALLGYQREHTGKAAGLRTHILVAVGSALYVLGAVEAGLTKEGLSRVIQGLVVGVGFLGAGPIFKPAEHGRVHGLTTAASIWLTAGLGTAIGLGAIIPAAAGALFGWMTLAFLTRFEHAMEAKFKKEMHDDPEAHP